MNDDWTKDIQRLMSDHEVKAPAGLLDEVKREMQRRGLEAGGRTSRTVSLWRYRWLAAAAAVAVLAIPVVWQLLPSDNSSVAKRQPSQTGTSVRQPSQTMMAASQIQKSPVSSLREAIETAARMTAGKGYPTLESPIPAAESLLADASVDSTSVVAMATANAASPRPEARQRSYRRDPLSAADDYTADKRRSSKCGGVTMSAYYGGSASGSDTGTSPQLMALDAVAIQGNPYGIYSLDMAGGNSNGLVEAKKHERKANHKQPVKVGVSVGYRLNDRWSINSGVTYSYLSSEFTEDNCPKETQHLHYVGIPLSASYSFVQSPKAEVYATAGGEIEKLVKGTRSMEDHADVKVKESRPQWSVKAAVGAAYHFTASLSVYAEPGVSYHFDNHSSVENVYKDRKTSFSLNIGLRVNVNK